MKRLLKTIFPVKSLDLKNANNNNQTEKNTQNTVNLSKNTLNEINSEIKNLKNDIIDFDNDAEKIKVTNGLKLLGELLSFLRTNKYMALLMICRRINELLIKDGVVEIDCDDCDEIFSNENYNEILRKFFAEKNLDLKQKPKEKEENNAEILNRLLGGKLVIK